jgi:hypothetical protein
MTQCEQSRGSEGRDRGVKRNIHARALICRLGWNGQQTVDGRGSPGFGEIIWLEQY